MKAWLARHIGLSLVLLSLAIIGLSLSRFWSPKTLVSNLVEPVAHGLRVSGQAIGSWFDDVIHIGSLTSQNSHLRQQVSELSGQLSQANQITSQNASLRQLLGFKPPAGYSTIGADIVSYEPDNLRSLIRLNRGSKDGVKVGQAVVNGDGLVGQVDTVDQNSSSASLLTDPEFRVLVVSQAHQVPGIIIGQGSVSGLTMQQIPLGQTITSGDLIVTSGLDGAFPSGLLIGTVARVGPADATIFQTATVTPVANLSRLSVVLILKNDGKN